jgi:hypothetical protein
MWTMVSLSPGVPPEELEQALGLEREHLAAGDLTLVVAREAEHVPTAETQVELGVGEPPCEPLGLGQRRPHLRRSRFVTAFEADGSSLAVRTELSLRFSSHRLPLLSSVSRASSRFARKLRRLRNCQATLI